MLRATPDQEHRLPGCGEALATLLNRMANDSPAAWFTYLLECADGTLYCGVTTDLERRVAEHNGELPGGARYTSGRRPVVLKAWAEFPDRAAACRAERRVKGLERKRKTAWLAAQARSQQRL